MDSLVFANLSYNFKLKKNPSKFLKDFMFYLLKKMFIGKDF